MSDDHSPTASDFLRADDVVAFMLRNFAIRYQTDGEMMDERTARAHFKNREALCRVRALLVAEAERIGLPPNT
jgi:hypothetical protein